ncbi:MAG: YDG domain-containing protein [Verrucomicrobiota bacterium]
MTVSGAVTVGVSGGTSSYGTINMTSGGTLICQNLAVGSMSGDSWVPGAGVVQLTASNTLPATLLTNFNSLIISAGTTILGTSLTVNNLTQSGGTLAGSNSVLVSNVFMWTGGAITGVVQCNGTGTIGKGSAKALQGGQLINAGTLNWDDNITTGNVTTPAFTLITNLPGATINLSAGYGTLNGGGTGTRTVANNGTITMTGSGSSPISDIFNNSGTVTLNGGTLTLSGGGTETGAFNSAASATNNLSGGFFAFNSGSSISGAGGFTVTSGTLDLNGSGPWQPGSVTISGGVLEGTATVQDSGPLSWTGGTVSNTVIYCVGGLVDNPFGTSGGQLINSGTMTWIPYPYTGNGSVISNAASGIINMTVSGNLTGNYYGGAATFYNAGQMNISGTGTSTVNDLFINTGTVNVSNGVFAAHAGGTNFGTINVASGGTFSASGGTFIFPATSIFSGGGNFTVGGATVNLGGANPWQFQSVTISGGVLQGAPVQCNGPLTWTGGTISNTVVHCIGGEVDNPYELNGGELINSGTMTWIPYPYTGNGSVISNTATGIINVTGSGYVTDDILGGAATFYNAGQMNISETGTATISDLFINTGTVNVSNGVFAVHAGGTNGGTINVATGATLSLTGGGMTNSGIINVASGGLFNANVGTFTSTATSVLSGTGGFMVSGATVNLTCSLNLSGTWTFSAGTANLTGTCSVNSNAVIVSGGTVNFNGAGPWQPGSLTISGGTLAGTAVVQDSGTLNWTGGLINGIVDCNGGALNALGGLDGGRLINSGTLSWLPYLNTGAGSVISNASSGVINVNDTNGQAVTLNVYGNPAAFYNAGLMTFSGTTGNLADAFTNTGTVTVSNGTFTVSGNHALAGGTLNFGLNSLTSFGQISLSGAALLGGTLSATLTNGFIPAVGNSWQVLSYGSLTGAFTKTNLPPVAVWKTTYGSTSLSIQVLKLVPTLAWTNPANIVYGAALSTNQLNATAASPINLATNLPGVFSYTPPLGATLNSGSNQALSVTFTPTDSVNYTNVTTKVAINVQPAPLTITANAQSKTYGQSVTFGSGSTNFTCSGLQNGDTVGTVTLDCGGGASGAPVSGSPYTITPSAATGGSGSETNYAITYVNSTLTLNPLAVALVGARPYDGTGTAAFGILSVANAVGTDQISLTSGRAALAAASIGSEAIASVGTLALGGSTAGNYTLSGASGSVNINSTPLSIIAGPQSKTYGQTLAFGIGNTNFTCTGLQNSETIGSVTLTCNGGAANAPVSGSPYAITPSAATGGSGTEANYTITYINGALGVSALPVVLVGTRPYDGTATANFGILSVKNAVGSDRVALASGGASVGGASVGLEAIASVGTLVLGGSAAGNYTLSGSSGSVDITCAELTVTNLLALDKIYNGGTNDTLEATNAVLEGVVSGDSLTLITSNSMASFADKNVGTNKLITVVGLGLGGLAATNYTLVYPTNLTATITPATLTVDGVAAQNKVYDGTTNAQLSGVAALDGEVSGDEVDLVTNDVVAGFASLAVGVNIPVSTSGYTITGADAGDYALTQPTGLTANITPATLTYIANTMSMVYGTAVPGLNGTVSGFVGGDTLGNATMGRLLFSTPASSASCIGSYPVNGSGLTADNGNYTFAQAVGNATALTVTSAPAAINLTGLAQSYNGWPCPVTVATVPSGLSVNVTYNGTISVPVNAGSYTVVATVTDPNYTGSVTNTLTVARAAQMVTIEPLATNLVTLDQFTNPIPVQASASSGLPVTLTLASNSPAVLTASNTLVSLGLTGTVTLWADQGGNSNYAAASEAELILEVTNGNQSISFAAIRDQVATNAPFVLSAAASSGLAVQLAVLDGPATIIGNVLTLTGAGEVTVEASQAGDSNWNAATSISQTFNVSLAEQEIIFGPLAAQAYGTEPFNLNATASSGLPVSYASDNLAVATVTGQTVTVMGAGTANITASQAGNGTHYGSALPVNQSFTVAPAVLTVTANNTNRVYGAVNPVFTASYSGFVNGDTLSSAVTGTPALNTLALTDSPVAGCPYTISLAYGTLSAANYSFNFVDGTLTIVQTLSAGMVTSSANPASSGTNVTFSVAVSAVAPGAGAPTGTVNFRIDGNVLGSGTLSGGVTALTTNTLMRGAHTVVAEYAGDGNFLGSTNSLSPNQVIDTPPVAGNVTIDRNPALGVQIRLSTLLTNASNIYGDTLNLSVSSTSASNATVTVSGGWVFYTPPTGYTNADSFAYIVTDSLGISATGTVTVAIQANSGQSQNLAVADLGDGSILINGNGIPGYRYRLQYSDTSVPFNWQNLETVTADNTGQFGYNDTSGSPTRFYRTVYP